MRRMTYFVMALALLLGFTQCKKEQIEPQGQGGQVRITLNVDNSNNDGSRVNVDPPRVTFEKGDKILVGYDGKYVGTITHNGTNFTGNITITQNGDRPLYFYFLGNKDTGTLTAGSTTNCTVNISDQISELPVISMAPSEEDFPSSGNTYTASLHNKCSLMKFNVTTTSTEPIYISGMYNTVTVNFDDLSANDGFSYSNAGNIWMKGKDSENVTWAIVLPQANLTGAGNAYTSGYSGTWNTAAVDLTDANQFITGDGSGISLTVNTEDNSRTLNLASVTANTTVADGWTLTGTLGEDHQISIADGATVMLDNAVIQPQGGSMDEWAGITCLGDATIVLKDGTDNTVEGFGMGSCAGIQVSIGNTLIIEGNTGILSVTGSEGGSGIGYGNIFINGGIINASGGSMDGSGIGCSSNSNCGNITINGGNITAIGSMGGAGIGSKYKQTCGDITINGGSVTARGEHDPGIGSGDGGYCGNITINGGTVTARSSNGAAIGGYSCGDITITSGVTQVTASTDKDGGYQCIGKSYSSCPTCGTVTIGNTVGAINAYTYTYPAPVPVGPLDKKFSVSSTEQVYFSPGNLQATYNGESWSWHFASNDYVYIGNAVGNTSVTSSSPWISGSGTVDLFGFSNGSDNYYGISTNSVAYSGDFVDWGSLPIESYTSNTWRTPTMEEWKYIFQTRNDYKKKYGRATVADKYGYVIVPDNWMVPDGLIFNSDTRYQWGWDYNIYTAEQWEVMKESGAVFLPVAGYRNGTSMSDVGSCGHYRTSNKENNRHLYFSNSSVSPNYWGGELYYGNSVRLVRDVN